MMPWSSEVAAPIRDSDEAVLVLFVVAFPSGIHSAATDSKKVAQTRSSRTLPLHIAVVEAIAMQNALDLLFGARPRETGEDFGATDNSGAFRIAHSAVIVWLGVVAIEAVAA